MQEFGMLNLLKCQLVSTRLTSQQISLGFKKKAVKGSSYLGDVFHRKIRMASESRPTSKRPQNPEPIIVTSALCFVAALNPVVRANVTRGQKNIRDACPLSWQ